MGERIFFYFDRKWTVWVRYLSFSKKYIIGLVYTDCCSRTTLVPDHVVLEKGELFFERYEVLNELGKGTYGVVRKVKKLDSSEFQAAKFIKCVKPSVKEKAEEEIDIMNCLRHPILLTLNAAFVNPKEVIMVTE